MGQVYASAGYDAAKQANGSPEMRAIAERARAAILAASAPHFKTGEWAASVKERTERVKGVEHILVEVTDPEALAIEYGHWWVTPDGKRIKWVKGIRIVNTAYDSFKGV